MNVVDSSGWIEYLAGGPNAAFFADPILDASLALEAAELSAEARLALADSVMLATARAHRAVLWTQDSDFQDMDDVRFRPRGES